MYFLLILFFGSLFGIIFMIGRKWSLLENRHMLAQERVEFDEVPFVKEVKHITIKSMKILGHASLVEIVRFSVKFSDFSKSKFQKIKVGIKNKINPDNNLADRKEISKFLKIISDYKHKIREIKHRIKQEEKNL